MVASEMLKSLEMASIVGRSSDDDATHYIPSPVPMQNVAQAHKVDYRKDEHSEYEGIAVQEHPSRSTIHCGMK
jgi:hypothetical protein